MFYWCEWCIRYLAQQSKIRLTVLWSQTADGSIYLLVISPHIKGIFCTRLQTGAFYFLIRCISTICQFFAQRMVHMISYRHRTGCLLIFPWQLHFSWIWRDCFHNFHRLCIFWNKYVIFDYKYYPYKKKKN